MTYSERRARMRRKPCALEPLAEHLGIRLGQPDGAAAVDGDNLTGTLAAMLDIGPRTVKRLRQQGMSVSTADRYAIRFGVHPAALWPEQWGRLEPEPGPAPAPAWMVRS